MRPMYARHRLDIGIGDLVNAAGPRRRTGRPETAPAGTLRCLSVRSGFHLLLEALDLPRGSEVVFSALTHPDLPRLAEHHGLVAVPVDLDPDTLAPRPALLESALSPRTRVVVVAHLFGGLVDLTPVAELARRAGALLVEDGAQAYAGPEYDGDPRAAVSMFSFGMLKTATAVGGAALHVRDDGLLARMDAIQARWARQDESAYLAAVARCTALLAGSRQLPYRLLTEYHRATGRDLDAVVNGAVRSFRSRSGAELARRLELRPCRSLLVTLDRRRARFDAGRLARRAAAGESAMELLPDGLFHPGSRMLRRTHWLFPVVTGDPDALVAAARASGFDAARAASNLCAIPAPRGRACLTPLSAARMLAGLVYLPMYPEIPEAERRRLLSEVVAGPWASPLAPRRPAAAEVPE
jgi:perosamine synthetase